MTVPPLVVSAESRGGFRLRLVFSDGTENTIDFAQWFEGPVFEPLKAPDFFARYFIDGGTVAWPNGADIAPETLYGVPGRRPVRQPVPARKGRDSRPVRPSRVRARREAG